MFRLKFTGISDSAGLLHNGMPPAASALTKSCSYKIAPEQKARTTYDNILRLVHDSDVCDPIKFLRAREIVHFQRFGEPNRTDLSKKPGESDAIFGSCFYPVYNYYPIAFS